MKKLLTFALAILILASLVSCSGKNVEQANTNTPDTNDNQQAQNTPASDENNQNGNNNAEGAELEALMHE